MDKCDVAILGAGPYGLSAAAHLCQIKGLDVRLLGEPMSFWERHMPEEMLLRSPWAGSHIADAKNQFTLDAYRTVNRDLVDPVPVRDFIKYGRWFQQQAAMPSDPRKVVQIELAPQGYRLAFETGDALNAQRVVVAAGIQACALRPAMFQGFPAELVTHTSEHRGFSRFRGKRVLVVGGGQSALEAAVFLHEAGAQTEVLIRKPALYWLDHRRWMRARPFRWMFYGAGEIGPAGASLIIQRPNLFRRLPRHVQRDWEKRAMRPAIAQWLKPSARNLAIRTQRFPIEARVEGEQLRLLLNDGTGRMADHVILGTGYGVNVARYSFLAPGLLARLDTADGYPRLDAGLESSLPGLHFLGAPAALSFGPLMRFVAGTEFASGALRRRVLQAGKRQRVFNQAIPARQLASLPLGPEINESE